MLLLLAGCSAARLAYDHLDSLIRWGVSDYIDFTPAQRLLLEDEIQPVWRWHRGTQLPLYAAELRRFADEALNGPLSRERIDLYLAHAEAYRQAVSRQALPGTARVLASLDDAQVSDMLERMRKEVARIERKRRKQAAEGPGEGLERETEPYLRYWTGRFTPEQHQLLLRWAAEVQAGLSQQTQEQYADLDRYAQVLATRVQPGFQQRLSDYFDVIASGGERQSQEAAERERLLRMLTELSALLQPQQRQHLHDRLLDYAEDCEVLAAEKVE
ncbi:MAG: DUF6279 family lipoprotein [Nevskia sp.]|nr:DUF6279 family lipoprotein [Nevskia sp.]